MGLLEAKNTQLLQRLEKKDNKDKTDLHRTFECFRTRILDTPWQQGLKPVTERFPEFENLVSQKVCAEFPLILYNLQQQLVDMAFKFDSEQQGFKVVEERMKKETELVFYYFKYIILQS
ncbi:hypothetical protein Hdeb2414_s0006g00194811 [Helianthus debilis subsp. tardiflorus]